MDRRRLVGVALIIVSAFGFASGTILSKPIYAHGLDWLQLVAWRFAIGTALGWAWIALAPTRRAIVRRLTRREALVALGLGAWYTGNAGTYYAGLETVPASLAGVLVYIYPAIVAALSVRYATRLAGRRPWLALAVAIVGVVLALGGIDVAAAPPLIGLVLVLASPVIYAGWIILAARLAGERSDRLAHETDAGGGRDAAVAATLMMTATAAVFVTAAVLTGRELLPQRLPLDVWPLLFGCGVLSTFLAIQTFYAGSRRIGAAQASLVSTVEPVMIVALAALTLNDVLRPIQLAGAALIIGAVVVAQTAPGGSGASTPEEPREAAGLSHP